MRILIQLNLNEVVNNLQIKQTWAAAFLREARKITAARIAGTGGDTGGAYEEGGEAADGPLKTAKKTKRQAPDDEYKEEGKDQKKKVAKVKKIRAKKVKTEEADELDGDEENGV